MSRPHLTPSGVPRSPRHLGAISSRRFVAPDADPSALRRVGAFAIKYFKDTAAGRDTDDVGEQARPALLGRRWRERDAVAAVAYEEGGRASPRWTPSLFGRWDPSCAVSSPTARSRSLRCLRSWAVRSHRWMASVKDSTRRREMRARYDRDTREMYERGTYVRFRAAVRDLGVISMLFISLGL